MTRDQALLRRAFHEAERAGWLTTAPNPRVGALALRGGHVVGYGHHATFGQAHAEEMALRDAGAWDEAAGCMVPGHVDEVVVSLEPCSARGGEKKRTPCVEHLLKAGVQRVIVGAIDPDPRHAGAAFTALREQGVEVVHLQEEQTFAAQNPAFLASLGHAHRPWILLKWAASLDGYTATPKGTSQWITSAEARSEVHVLRSCSHGVMAGKGTLQVDTPRLTARAMDGQPDKSVSRILVDGLRAARQEAPILADPVPRFWIEEQGSRQELPGWWSQHDHLLEVPRTTSGALEVGPALEDLRSGHRHQRVLVEGGSRLQGYLLQQGLVDAVVRYEAPLMMVGGLGSCQAGGYAHPQEGLHLHAEERADLGPDLRRAFLIRQP